VEEVAIATIASIFLNDDFMGVDLLPAGVLCIFALLPPVVKHRT